MPASAYPLVVGVDIGGTKLAAATVGSDGEIGSISTTETPHGAGAILDQVSRLIADAAGGRQVRHVGIGAAGMIDPGTARVVAAADTIVGWAGTDLRAGITARLVAAGLADGGLTVSAVNDVDAQALGEASAGAGAGFGRVLVVAAGTGVGAAIVEHGHPLLGSHHSAGEFGHTPVPGTYGLTCSCGRADHLESIGSGPGLLRRFRALGGDELATTYEVVASDDPRAVQAVRESATALGLAIAGLCNMIDPDAVVITGGMSKAGERWWETVRATVAAHTVDPLAGLPVLAGTLGLRAAILGAAMVTPLPPQPSSGTIERHHHGQ